MILDLLTMIVVCDFSMVMKKAIRHSMYISGEKDKAWNILARNVNSCFKNVAICNRTQRDLLMSEKVYF